MARRQRRSVRRKPAVAAALLLACLGQLHSLSAATPAPASTVADVLQQMSGRAAVIFVGQVLAVRRASESFGPAHTPSASGVVEVDLRVDRAIRGCSPGVYTLREWAGLWVIDDQRYHVGERLLMLLHAPGAAGLSSPVDGLDGAIPIRQGGSATPYRGTTQSVPIVDLRWLGTKLQRPLAYRSASTASAAGISPPVPLLAGTQMLIPSRAGGAVSVGTITPSSEDAAGGSVPAQQLSVQAAIDMLTSWEKARNVGP